MRSHTAKRLITLGGPGSGPRPGYKRVMRGMSNEEHAEILKSGVYKPHPANSANDVTTDLETAKYYASDKAHDFPGVAIQFDVPEDVLKPDLVTKEDFKVTRPVDASNHVVIHRSEG